VNRSGTTRARRASTPRPAWPADSGRFKNEAEETVFRDRLLERTERRIRVVLGGVVVADTRRAWRVLETSHPPVYYVPPEDVLPDVLEPADGSSFCEWKGRGSYLDVVAGGARASRAAWTYRSPSRDYAVLEDHVAFYPGPMDACFLDDEQVTAQPGDFYGGWITSDLAGPFKGLPGSSHW